MPMGSSSMNSPVKYRMTLWKMSFPSVKMRLSVTMKISSRIPPILIGGILLLIFIVTDKRILTLGKLIFQSVMRYLTGLFIELDPIGILKNYIGEMKKNLAVMDEQLGN